MASRKYRENAREIADKVISDIETDVLLVIDNAKKIDTDSISGMKEGIETIIYDLEQLADKLY